MVGTPLASNHGIKVFKRSKCKSTHVIQNLFCGIQIIFSPANTGGGVRCLPTIQVGCYWEHLPLPSQYISYSLDKYPILSFLLYGLCSRALSPTPPIQLSPVGQVGHALEHPTSQLGHVWEQSTARMPTAGTPNARANTSLAAPGALAHRLQRRTACNT